MQDNSKTLLVYVVEKYYEKLKHIHYVDIFERMKIKYTQVCNNLNYAYVSCANALMLISLHGFVSSLYRLQGLLQLNL